MRGYKGVTETKQWGNNLKYTLKKGFYTHLLSKANFNIQALNARPTIVLNQEDTVTIDRYLII